MSLNQCCLHSQFPRHICHSKIPLLSWKKKKNGFDDCFEEISDSACTACFHRLFFDISRGEAEALAAALGQDEGPCTPVHL